jgi:hypothetical protein
MVSSVDFGLVRKDCCEDFKSFGNSVFAYREALAPSEPGSREVKQKVYTMVRRMNSLRNHMVIL